jgi:thiol-disulfide isomerase/thioredoxin
MGRPFIFSLFLLVPSTNIFAFNYFEKEINYWNNSKSNDKSVKAEQNRPKKEKKDSINFNWDQYINPKTKSDLKEVFREGDYTPPTPLLEVAKNPTDQNIKNWFKTIETKNRIMAKVNERLSEYLKKKTDLTETDRSFTENRKSKAGPKNIDFKRFRFRMYFESSCPHCKRMMPELLKLQDMGFFVELRQVDNNKKYRQSLPFVVRQASPKELKEKKVDAWPVLFIGDTQKKLIYRLNGFQDANSILLSIQSK